MKKIAILFLLAAISLTGFAQVTKKTTTTKKVVTTTKPVAKPAVKPTVKAVSKPTASKETRIKITTDLGNIVLKLYDSTPLHRDNFIKLVKQGFFDSLMFHRVISGFMIQGGDPTSKTAPAGTMLGAGGGDMQRIPAEFVGSYIHKRGALAAARDGNPEKASSACQFYIVDGSPVTDDMLNGLEMQTGKKYTVEQRAIYKSLGGTPMLDTNYTVFGETISGQDVIDRIAEMPKDGNNRPFTDIRMKIEIVK